METILGLIERGEISEGDFYFVTRVSGDFLVSHRECGTMSYSRDIVNGMLVHTFNFWNTSCSYIRTKDGFGCISYNDYNNSNLDDIIAIDPDTIAKVIKIFEAWYLKAKLVH